MTDLLPPPTITYTYTREWRSATDPRPHTVTTTVHRAAATAGNDPRPDHDGLVLIAWDRAGLPTVDFGHTTATCDGRPLRWDDWANPDAYWADGNLWQWHCDLVARCGPAAVACLVAGADDGTHVGAAPAFGLGDFTATARAVAADGRRALGLAVTAPGLFADPADWYPGLAACEDFLHRHVHRVAAWCAGHLYEIRQRVDGGDETIVTTSYGTDAGWAATKARLVADRYAAAAG